MPFLRRYFNWLGLLFSIILAASLYLVFYLYSGSCLIKGQWCGQDIDQYTDYATNMLSGHGFSARKVINMYYVSPKERVYIPEILRVPAYPLVLAIGKYFYNNPKLLFYVNFFSFVGIIFYSYQLMKIYLGKWYVLFGIAILALSPTVLFYTGYMGNVDIFVCFVTTASFFYILKLFKEKKIINILFATLFGGLAILSRQNVMIVTIPFIALLLFFEYYQKKRIHIRLLVVFLALLIIVFTWSLRNLMLTGLFTFSAASGEQLFTEHVYFTPFATKESLVLVDKIITRQYGEVYMARRRSAGVSIPKAYVEIDTLLNKTTWKYIEENPKITFFQYLLAQKSLFTQRTFNWTKKDIFSTILPSDSITGWVLLILFVSFIFVHIGQFVKKHTSVYTLWVSTAFFLIASAFYHGIVIGNRGILPVFPIVILLSLYALKGIIEKLKKLL